MANIPRLQKFGLKLLESENLQKDRLMFNFSFELTDENIKNFLTKEFNADTSKIEIIHKTFDAKKDNNKGLSFHIDDCQVVTMKNPPTYDIDKYIHIDGKYYLYCTSKHGIPKYTFVFYSSTQDKDFTGGTLMLVDGENIVPKENTGFKLNGMEVHMVTPIKSGIRKSTVVKIY